MFEALLFGAVVVPPLPDPHTVISEPCEIAAELGFDSWLSTCEGAEPLASGLGDQIETVGFKFRLEEGEIVGPSVTLGYVAEFDQGVNRASVVVGLVCVDSVTGEIEAANGAPSELWLLRDHEGLATGWVTVSTDGQCGVGQRRDIVVLSVQSTSDTPWRESGPPGNLGWDDGVTTSWWNGNRYTWRVVDWTGEYPGVGTATVEMTLAENQGSWPANNDRVGCPTLTGSGSNLCTFSSGNGYYTRGWPGYADGVKPPAGTTKTFEVSFAANQIGLSVGFLERSGGAGAGVLRWLRPGVPDRYEPADRWWTSGTVTAFDRVDEIIWVGRPADPTVTDVAGLCENGDVSACVDRCMDLFDPSWLPWETAASFIDFVRCLLVPQTSLGAVIGAAVDDLRASTTWQVVDVSLTTFIDSSTLPSQYALPCGKLLTVELAFGSSVDVGTCDIPPSFTKVVYWTSTVLMSLAFAFGIVYLVFWALNWRMPFNAPEAGEDE